MANRIDAIINTLQFQRNYFADREAAVQGELAETKEQLDNALKLVAQLQDEITLLKKPLLSDE